MNETVDPDLFREAKPAPAPLAPGPQRKRGRMGRWLAALVLAIVVVAVGIHYEQIGNATLDANKATKPSGPPAQTIRAAEITTGDMPITIDALGTVTPLASVTIRTQIPGKLMSVGFKEGQLVKEGDFLAQIDSRPYEATMAQYQGQLEKDTALYQQSQADLARYQTLKSQDSIARQQVEDQVYLVAQYKAAMATDQAQIDAAKLNISYTHIVSPIAGRVGLRLVDPGNYVQPTDSNGIVVVTQLDPISVVFSTPEDNLPRISSRFNSGAKLQVTAFDRDNVHQLAVGELTTFDNQVDVTTGTFKLRANFANPANALFPNQFVNVRLLVDTEHGVVLAPNAAIQIGAQGPFVYVVKDDDTVAVRKVTPGAADATHTVIAAGLAAGEKVVTDGVDRLRDGSKIRFAGARSEGAAGAAHGGAAPGAGAGEAGAQTHRHKHENGGASGAPAAGATP